MLNLGCKSTEYRARLKLGFGAKDQPDLLSLKSLHVEATSDPEKFADWNWCINKKNVAE